MVYPNRPRYKIAITGPTNKSVRVIKKATSLNDDRIFYMTIHKLLGLTEVITKDGKQEFKNKGDFRSKIGSINLLFIDEVSMLDDELFHKIIKYRNKVKIIFIGDPAQIPPVGKPDCIPFRDELLDVYGIKTLELKEIMRQKLDNPIISSSILIRENLEKPRDHVETTTILDKNGDGIEFLNLNNPEIRGKFLSLLDSYFNTEEFRNDAEYVKIIAWRNKTVATMNNLVRRIIYGSNSLKSKILIGEKLIANNPIIESGEILFNTNDEFVVESFSIKNEKKKINNSDEFVLKYYETNVSFLNEDGKKISYYIDILHEDSEDDFIKISNELKKIAIEKQGKEKTWIKYYDFLRRFANISYSYAGTGHKAQGSTYRIAFVLEDDIETNIDIIERNRIKYTCYTRPSNKLYILKRF